MLRMEAIKLATTEWARPFAFAQKKDGSHFFCIDYQEPNFETIRDLSPLLRIDECTDFLGGARILSD